jgi:hypothetical protein
VMIEFEERADAAHGAWHVSDTMVGNEVLALARDGVPLGLSVGFAEVPGGSRWSPDRSRWSGPGPRSTTWPWSACQCTWGPGWWASVRVSPGAPIQPCSPWPGSVGKSSSYYTAPHGARRGPWACIGCKKKIVWGDRCEACKKELRRRVARRRR